MIEVSDKKKMKLCKRNDGKKFFICSMTIFDKWAPKERKCKKSVSVSTTVIVVTTVVFPFLAKVLKGSKEKETIWRRRTEVMYNSWFLKFLSRLGKKEGRFSYCKKVSVSSIKISVEGS